MTPAELKKRYGIGITGGIACGKSTVSGILRSLGYFVVDADQLARDVVEPGSRGLAKIVESFGGGCLDQKGALNRAAMRERVFAAPEKRKQLEAIIHPMISARLNKILKSRSDINEIWFYEASLLFETGHGDMFREVWLVDCPAELQRKRLLARSGLSEEVIGQIIESQMSGKDKSGLADYVIDTRSPIAELEPKIKNALRRLRSGQEFESKKKA